MNSKILCILPICVNPSNNHTNKGDERINQYVEGLNKFFEYLHILNKHTVDIIIFDNTLAKNEKLPEKILNIIPTNVKIINDVVNNYGCHNKGAGLIECWKYCSDILKEYNFLIHFEPRQLLLNFNFIQQFLDNPCNLFTKSATTSQFNTGLFCIECEILINFIDSVNLNLMCSQSICIESNLYDYFEKNNISFCLADKMELIWFPYLVNELIM